MAALAFPIGPESQWLRAPPADEEFLGSNLTATTTLSGFPRHEMTPAVNVALNKHSNSNSN